ncbi:hypothetical protein [Enterococcus sp. AZ103]|uniref:hypothetical protein n=1 Tax=Enterococcus sp. AZ103 TaxID=2774628 RepID=UPI003F1EDD9B
MIKINAKRKFIPVEIGSNTFEFDLSDDAVLKMEDTLTKVVKKIESISISDELSKKERVSRLKQAQRESFDFLLGKGAYDKVYSEVKSVDGMTDVLIELENQMPQEIEAAMVSDKSKKYLGE